MSRPRVLVVADYYLPGFRAGGPVRAISNTIRRLNSDVDFSVVTRDHDAGSSKYPDVEAGHWTGGPAGRVRYAPRLTPALLRRCVADTACDIIWLNSFFSRASIAVLAFRRVGWIRRPVLLAPRGELSPGALALKRRRKAIAMRLLRWTGCLRSIHWLASSDAERQDMVQAIGASPITCVAESVADVPTADQPWPAKSPRRLRALFAARIAPTKNLHFLLEVLARCDGEIHLDIVGPLEDPAYWAQCRALIPRLPAKVTAEYAGQATHRDLQRRLSTYDVLILPTLGENFGHVIIEAWAAGCPVLVSDRTPWRQLTSRGLGWDVPLNHEKWAAAIGECLDMTAEAHLAMRRRVREQARRVWQEGIAGDASLRRLIEDAAHRPESHPPMRVGIVAPDLREPGGVREKALFVARSLRDQLGASVQFVSLATSRTDASSVLLHKPRTWRRPLVSRYTLEEFTVDHVGAVGAEIEVARYARRGAILRLVDRCDVLHVVCGTPAWAYAVSGFRGPVIVHFASFVKHERGQETARRRSALDGWRHLMTSSVGLVERAALRRADVIIPVNETRRVEVRATVSPTTPVEVVHTGVDTARFSPGPYREYGYLLTVGRLDDPRKNLPLLLRAYGAARARTPDLPRLVLAGVSAPASESRELISALGLTGSVEYIGPQDPRTLVDTYRGASAFVLSSNEEGQGIVIVEAMASGLPIVSTACVGPSELVTDGVEGLLTPVGSADALASALVRITTTPELRRRMSHAARGRAVRDFSLDRTGAQLCRVYRTAGITRHFASSLDRQVVGEA